MQFTTAFTTLTYSIKFISGNMCNYCWHNNVPEQRQLLFWSNNNNKNNNSYAIVNVQDF